MMLPRPLWETCAPHSTCALSETWGPSTWSSSLAERAQIAAGSERLTPTLRFPGSSKHLLGGIPSVDEALEFVHEAKAHPGEVESLLSICRRHRRHLVRSLIPLISNLLRPSLPISRPEPRG